MPDTATQQGNISTVVSVQVQEQCVVSVQVQEQCVLSVQVQEESVQDNTIQLHKEVANIYEIKRQLQFKHNNIIMSTELKDPMSRKL